jgi:DNA-binding protein HU-beta
MNASELIDAVAGSNGLSKAEAKKKIETVFETISAATNGNEVAIDGFGSFKVKSSVEREGRKPSTGEIIKIAASKKLGIAAAKAIKDSLNG